MSEIDLEDAAQDRLVDLIYDAALDDTLWPGVLEHISDRTGAHCSNLLQIDISDGHGFGFAARCPDDTVPQFFAEWTQRNPLGLVEDPAAYCRDWAPRTVRDDECFDRNLLKRSDFFNEFLDRIGAHHMMIARLSLHDNSVISIGLGRPARYGAFDDDAIARMEFLQPHLVRAERLWRALGLRQSAFEQFDTLLASSPDTIFFLDDRLQVRHWTASADAMVRRGGALRRRGRALQALEGNDDQRLQAAFATALAGGAPQPVRLRGASAGEWVSVSVARLGERSMAGITGARCLLVSVTGPGTTGASQPSVWQAYGLTVAEEEIARAIVEGLTLRELADRRGVSVNTVRNQLSAVFDKTGVRRQQDLFRLQSRQALRG